MKHPRGWLVVLALLLTGNIALLLGSCGEDTPTSALETTVVEAADRLVTAQGGDEQAFFVTMLALDRGYDADQLLSAALQDRVGSDGRITRPDGSELSPTYAPEGTIQGLYDDPPDTGVNPSPKFVSHRFGSTPHALAVALILADPPAVSTMGGLVLLTETFQDFRAELEEQKAAAQQRLEERLADERRFQVYVTHVTMMLASRGYGVQQIVEAVLLRRVKMFGDPAISGEGFCYYIEHTSGAVLKPINPPIDPIQELTCPAAEEDAPTSFAPDDFRTVEPSDEPAETSYRDYQGEYVGKLTWWTTRGNIVDILSSEARVIISGPEISGRVQFVAKVATPIPGHPNRTQRLTLTADFNAFGVEDGLITGKGTSTTQFEMISCEHPGGVPCDNYVATKGGTGDITVLATIQGGLLEGQLLWGQQHNYSFDGWRQ